MHSIAVDLQCKDVLINLKSVIAQQDTLLRGYNYFSFLSPVVYVGFQHVSQDTKL
jgi:hypothetical protein